MATNLVYFLQRKDGAIKIGTTSQYINRISKLILEHGELKLLGLINGGFGEEANLHSRFSYARIKGTEFFRPDPRLLEYITNHTHRNVPEHEVLKTVRLNDESRAWLTRIAGKMQARFGINHTPDHALKLIHDNVTDDLLRKWIETYEPEEGDEIEDEE